MRLVALVIALPLFGSISSASSPYPLSCRDSRRDDAVYDVKQCQHARVREKLSVGRIQTPRKHYTFYTIQLCLTNTPNLKWILT